LQKTIARLRTFNFLKYIFLKNQWEATTHWPSPLLRLWAKIWKHKNKQNDKQMLSFVIWPLFHKVSRWNVSQSLAYVFCVALFYFSSVFFHDIKMAVCQDIFIISATLYAWIFFGFKFSQYW
jgi:hypothetical protein